MITGGPIHCSFQHKSIGKIFQEGAPVDRAKPFQQFFFVVVSPLDCDLNLNTQQQQ